MMVCLTCPCTATEIKCLDAQVLVQVIRKNSSIVPSDGLLFVFGGALVGRHGSLWQEPEPPYFFLDVLLPFGVNIARRDVEPLQDVNSLIPQRDTAGTPKGKLLKT